MSDLTTAELIERVRVGVLAFNQKADELDVRLAALSELEERCKWAEADGAMDRENARAALARAEAAERERNEQFSGRVQANRRARDAEARVRELEEALLEWERIFPAHRAECLFLTERGCTCGLDEAHHLTRAALATASGKAIPPEPDPNLMSHVTRDRDSHPVHPPASGKEEG